MTEIGLRLMIDQAVRKKTVRMAVTAKRAKTESQKLLAR